MLTSGPLQEMCQIQWLGAVDAARALDCDLYLFVGNKLGHPDRFGSQANAV